MSMMSPQEKAISDAAIKVIVNQGFDVVSVRKVAQQAGVAPNSAVFYGHERRTTQQGTSALGSTTA